MLDGFTRKRVRADDAEIAVRVGGSGPPLLLLHGYPQTHVMWHKVAPELARHFTVVLADLRGYGDSEKPPGGDRHAGYAKRAMAQDQAQVMTALGFERFHVVGHDRGGRVAHRLAIDHADRVTKLAVLDIAPTLKIYESTNQAFATAYYHWFFLIQPFDLPERLIGADPEFYLHRKMAAWGKTGATAFTEAAMAEYLRCFRDPATIHATCEDYRAAATIDLEHHRADRVEGRRIACPMLALWGTKGVMEANFDVLETWREVSNGKVTGIKLDCGHFLAEEKPQETATALIAFLEG